MPRGRMPRSNTTGQQLREIRKKKGLTLAQLAKVLGLSKSYLSATERSGGGVPQELERAYVGFLEEEVHKTPAFGDLPFRVPDSGAGADVGAGSGSSHGRSADRPQALQDAPISGGRVLIILDDYDGIGRGLSDFLSLIPRDHTARPTYVVLQDHMAQWVCNKCSVAQAFGRHADSGQRMTFIVRAQGDVRLTTLVRDCLPLIRAARTPLYISAQTTSVPGCDAITVPGHGAILLLPSGKDDPLCAVSIPAHDSSGGPGHPFDEVVDYCRELEQSTVAVARYVDADDPDLDFKLASIEQRSKGEMCLVQRALPLVHMDPDQLVSALRTRVSDEVLHRIRAGRMERRRAFVQLARRHRVRHVVSRQAIEELAIRGTIGDTALPISHDSGPLVLEDPQDRGNLIGSMIDSLQQYPNFELGLTDDAGFAEENPFFIVAPDEAFMQVLDGEKVACYLESTHPDIVKDLRQCADATWGQLPEEGRVRSSVLQTLEQMKGRALNSHPPIVTAAFRDVAL